MAELTIEEIAEIRKILPLARSAADMALSYFFRCIENEGVDVGVYARRDRIKTEDDIVRKVTSKIRDKDPAYKWENITDIVGVRFITLYKDDIPAVTNVIAKALLGEYSADEPRCPFSRDGLSEFKLFLSNSNPTTSRLNARIGEIATRLWQPGDKWKYEGPILDERYSSVHLVARTTEDKKRNLPSIPIEIQIRSVFEDAWGEIDHALLYEPRREGAAIIGDLLHIERHSSALKKLMDAAADFADALRLLRAPEAPPANPMRPTIDSANFHEWVCEVVGVPLPTTEKFIKLIRQKEKLDDAVRRRDSTASLLDYTRWADEFAVLAEEQQQPGGYLAGKELGSEAREFYYLVRMEESVCRLLSLDEKQVSLAIDRLTEVTDEFPDHPVAWLRLGEAYARRMQMDNWGPGNAKAAELGDQAYISAAIRLDGLTSLADRRREFAASDIQQTYIRDNLSRLHGFLIWRAEGLARCGNPANTETLSAVRRALELTLSALPTISSSQRHEHLNSMLYYLAELIDLSQKLSMPLDLPAGKAELLEHLDEFQSGASATGPLALQEWDTIAYARFALDTAEAASRAAKKVLVIHQQMLKAPSRPSSEYLREQEALAIGRALQIAGIRDD